MRSLPSPKALGRRPRAGASPLQGPAAATLQLPEPDYDHSFQGTAGAEDGQDGPGENSQAEEEKPTPTNP